MHLFLQESCTRVYLKSERDDILPQNPLGITFGQLGKELAGKRGVMKEYSTLNWLTL